MQPKCECGADQVPGRTISESELKTLAARVGHLERVGDDSRALLSLLGITITPDPEPTNAELLAAQIRLTLRENSPGTCKNAQDVVAESIAKDLDKAGVKAPGGDDD